MAIQVKLRTIGQFPTSDPTDLDRALGQLEESLNGAVRLLSEQAETAPTVKSVAYANATVQVGELLPVDSSGGNVHVTLPPATPMNRGKRVYILRTSTSNTITLTAIPSAKGVVLINGLATVTLLTSVGVRRYMSDGANWWAEV